MNLKNASSIVLNVSVKIVIYVILAGILYFAGSNAYEFGKSVFSETSAQSAPGKEVTVNVESGMSNRQLAKMFKKNGLIKDESVFVVQAILYECKPVAGEYTLNTSYSAQQLIELISTVPVEEEEQEETQTEKETNQKKSKTKE